MANATHLLLVEGESDKNFFEKLCELLKLNTCVRVAPPKEVGGDYNNKEGVFNHLPVELQQIADGQLQRLAMVVDADYENYGGGCQRTLERVKEIVQPFKFELVPSKNNLGGLRFKSADGLADLGLWVMPNNQDEGMLEDWIRHCVIQDEQSLFQHAENVVSALPQPKFNPIHRTKAEVASWLAWQSRPGHGLYRVLWQKDILIDQNNLWYQGLANWLRDIYR